MNCPVALEIFKFTSKDVIFIQIRLGKLVAKINSKVRGEAYIRVLGTALTLLYMQKKNIADIDWVLEGRKTLGCLINHPRPAIQHDFYFGNL